MCTLITCIGIRINATLIYLTVLVSLKWRSVGCGNYKQKSLSRAKEITFQCSLILFPIELRERKCILLVKGLGLFFK